MAKDYQERKEQVADHLRDLSAKGRDIGTLPKVVDPDRRERCRSDFRLFCETYFSAVFSLAWSDDHLRVIGIIEDAVLNGGLFAVAMPRGSGKTSLSVCAAEWALLYGHRSFVVLIGATEEHAEDLLTNIVIDWENNDLLADDFPEVCHPIRALEGIVNRAKGQTCEGERTNICWTKKELILPTIDGSIASGAVVKVAGITGRVRGMKVSRPSDGASIRPDFVLVDDPQTDESANSPVQVRRRLGTIRGAILGLAGPDTKIAAVMPVTIIARGDVADQVLDRKKCPDWQGLKFGLLKSIPTNAKRWEEYGEVRARALREDDKSHPETAFYLEHQVELDKGGEASWPARFYEGEASAIQHAMNLRLERGEEAFFAEYQNAPLSLEVTTPLDVTADQVIAKAVDLKRNVVPQTAQKLTAFIDVQGSILFYAVVAFCDDMTAHVIDYGTYPDQKRNYFTLRELADTLATKKKGASAEAQLFAGLDALTTKLTGTTYRRDVDGSDVRISRLMIDAGWETATIRQFCRQSILAGLLLPSMGRAVTAKNAPLEYWKKNSGDRIGWKWRINAGEGHLLADVNAWKTFVAQRLLSPLGEPGTLTIFKAKPEEHRMFADHVSSEKPTLVSANGRDIHEWSLRPNRENHWLDCLIGCYVAAGEQGVTYFSQQAGKGTSKKRRKLRVNA